MFYLRRVQRFETSYDRSCNTLFLPVRLQIAKKGPFQGYPPSICLPAVQGFGEMLNPISYRGIVRDDHEYIVSAVQFLQPAHCFRCKWNVVTKCNVVYRVA